MTPADLDRLAALYEKAAEAPMWSERRAFDIAVWNNFPALLEAARKAPRWIPVGERLPEKYQPVALLSVERFESCHFDRNIQAAGYLDNMASHRPYWSIRGERATVLEAFTHWMPLPASPQKEGAK